VWSTNKEPIGKPFAGTQFQNKATLYFPLKNQTCFFLKNMHPKVIPAILIEHLPDVWWSAGEHRINEG
jgi:hypothetical protein